MVFYRIFIWLYPKIAFLLGFWNQKAKAWHQGRRQIFTHLEEAFRDNKQPDICTTAKLSSASPSAGFGEGTAPASSGAAAAGCATN